MKPQSATLYGLIAILLWSTITGGIRTVTESYGTLLGIALIYTLGSIMLCLRQRPSLKGFPRKYLIIGAILFVSYEICLSISIGHATSRTQAIEVSMLNYLWPSFTVLFAILMNKQKVNILVIPGMALALTGILWVVSGEQSLSFTQTLQNLQTNPLSYGLAFIGAILWALYCNITRKYANGKDGVTLFFSLICLTLWIMYAFGPKTPVQFSWLSTVVLFCIAFAMAAGYALWNIGILRGNMTLLATASYFTPVLSTLFASYLLSTSLSYTFWQGVAMVTAGSLLCWLSSRKS